MKKTKIIDTQNSLLNHHCIPEWLPVINLNKKDIHLKKGQQVFKEGEAVKGVFFIVSGKVKIHQHWGANKEAILRFASDGDMIGFRGLGRERIYPVTATTMEEVKLIFIDINFFESTLKVNPKLTYALMELYANELEDTERRIRTMAHLEVKGRVAETFLFLQSKFGITEEGFINVKLTKQEIASFVGTTYETISRITNELEKEKYIITKGKNTAIIKPQHLKNLIPTVK